MGRKPENSYRQAVHKHLPASVYHVKMNNPYAAGIPDDWYSGAGGDLWCEYKFLPALPQRANIDVAKLLSPLQFKWLTDRYVEGRSVAVIIGSPAGGIVLQNLEWQRTLLPEEFKRRLMTHQAVADWILQQTEAKQIIKSDKYTRRHK